MTRAALSSVACCLPLLVALPATALGQGDTSTPAPPVYVAPPYVKAQTLFFENKLPELDPLVASLVEKDPRNEEGQPELALVTEYLGYAVVPRDGDLETGKQRIQAWLAADPKSPFAPILEAIRLRSTGWRARGNAYSSQVTNEGWEIFREQTQAAWTLLMNSKKQSSRIPSWYSLAIICGRDAGVPEKEILAVFNEGIRRFPGFYKIQTNYLRELTPTWGGSFEAADAFILQQIPARAGAEGDILYTRLYWALDDFNGDSASFFTFSRVDWPRMRSGFNQILAKYPKAIQTLTVFGAYACRAQDEVTYRKLRPQLTGENFMQFVSSTYTLEVCDRRFAGKAKTGT